MAHYPQNDFIPDINSCFDAISECLTTWATVMSLAQVIHTSGKTENVFDAVEMAVMVGAVDVANDTISDFLKKYRAYPVMKPGGSIGMPMPGEELPNAFLWVPVRVVYRTFLWVSSTNKNS